MNFNRLREVVTNLLNGFREVHALLKPERIQDQSAPTETPMTPERIRNRAAEVGFKLIYAPVAIRKVYRYSNFAEAMASACGPVAQVAAEYGHAPRVVVDGANLVITLGVDIPSLLSEADFDVAGGLKVAFEMPEADGPPPERDTASEFVAEPSSETDGSLDCPDLT